MTPNKQFRFAPPPTPSGLSTEIPPLGLSYLGQTVNSAFNACTGLSRCEPAAPHFTDEDY